MRKSLIRFRINNQSMNKQGYSRMAYLPLIMFKTRIKQKHESILAQIII